MKTITFQVTEEFSNGNSNELAAFATENEAREFFAEQLKEDGCKPIDLESSLLQVNKLTWYEDELEEMETITSQMTYFEGTLDRNPKGPSIDYGFTSVWKSEHGELEYSIFRNGEKEKTILESELKDWFFH